MAVKQAYTTETGKEIDVGPGTPNPSTDFNFEVAAGRVPGVTDETFTAISETIDTTQVTVWGGTGELILPAAAENWTVVSTSANDAVGGTGAQEITLSYLIGGYTIVVEVIQLNGTTPVPVTIDGLRVHRLFVTLTGSSKKNDGDITLCGTNDLAIIKAGMNKAEDGVFTVPAGSTGYLLTLLNNASKGFDTIIEVFNTTGDDGIFLPSLPISAYQSNVPVDIVSPIEFPEKTDIKIVALSTNPGTKASVGFQMRLIENG